MKSLFVHDHVFHSSPSGDFYSGGGLPQSVWARYLNFSDCLTVIGRSGMTGLTTQQTQKLALSSRERVDFKLAPSLSGLKNRLRNYKYANSLLLKEIQDCDRVVVRLPSELGLLAVKIAIKLKKPVAIEMVDCPWDGYWNYGSFVAKLYAPFMYLRVRRAIKLVDHVTYVTSQFLQSRYPAKSSAVTSACSNVMLPELEKSVLDRRLARQPSDMIYFGLVGSLKGKLKGIYDAIAALDAIKNDCPNIRLRVLGDGDPTPFIEYAVKLGVADLVSFDGVLPGGARVFEWLDDIDIYIHPSYKEGLPRAVIEAMSRGCPVAASCVAGTPELLDKEFLFMPGDISALSFNMRRFYSDSALRASQSARNFEVSRRYESKILESVRFKFWSVFYKS